MCANDEFYGFIDEIRYFADTSAVIIGAQSAILNLNGINHLELVIPGKASGAEPSRTTRTHPLSLEQSQRQVAVLTDEIAPDIATHLPAGN